jgi:AcrR family transcriptional regulator
MTRPYRLGEREKSVQETRRKILAATVESIRENGLIDTHIKSVAKKAGVGRQTVYYNFQTQEDLWVAAFYSTPFVLDKKLFLQSLSPDIDPVQATKAWLEAWTDLWIKEAIMIRALKSLIATNEKAATFYKDELENPRRDQAKMLVDRLVMEGRIKTGLTLPMAAFLLSYLGSFSLFDDLHRQQKSRPKALAFLLELFEQTMLE